MAEKATVTFFRIRNCGYFKRKVRGAKTSTTASGTPVLIPAFAQNSVEFFSSLYDWLKRPNRTILETLTVPDLADGNSKILCLQMEKLGADEYVMILWVESIMTEGAQASIDPKAKVGTVNAGKAAVKEGHIPGHPAYFWVMPKKNLVAALKFQERSNSRGPFEVFMRGFLTHYSSYCVKTCSTDGSQDQFGYAFPGSSSKPISALPKFDLTPHFPEAKLDKIRSNREHIKFITERTYLKQETNKANDWIGSLVGRWGITKPRTVSRAIKSVFRIEYIPTEDDLEKIFTRGKAIVEDHKFDDDWSDIGFDFNNGATEEWLDHGRRNLKSQLDVARTQNLVVTAASLIKALEKQGSVLLSNADL